MYIATQLSVTVSLRAVDIAFVTSLRYLSAAGNGTNSIDHERWQTRMFITSDFNF